MEIFSFFKDELPGSGSQIANTIPPIVFRRPRLQLKVLVGYIPTGLGRRGERDA